MIGSDDRYYAEAEDKPKGMSKEDFETAQAKLNGTFNVEPEVEANKSVDPDSHPAAGGEKKAEAAKASSKK